MKIISNAKEMSNLNLSKTGCIIILSGPSGTGKTTLNKKLVEEDKNIEHSISVTTRPPRDDEQHGVDYYFADKDAFSAMVISNKMLEFTEIYGNYYGTPKENVEERINSGGDVIFDIDPAGAKAIKSKLPDHTFTVYILPPSIDTLSERLFKRGKDTDINIAERIGKARDEMRSLKDYDYVIINENLDQVYSELKAIISAERNKRSRIIDLSKFLEEITAF